MDTKYISKSIGAGLLEAFCHSMGMNIYDVTTQGGYCLCHVATECTADEAQIVFIQVHSTGVGNIPPLSFKLSRKNMQNLILTYLSLLTISLFLSLTILRSIYSFRLPPALLIRFLKFFFHHPLVHLVLITLKNFPQYFTFLFQNDRSFLFYKAY
jgi:hypothetical protein